MKTRRWLLTAVAALGLQLAAAEPAEAQQAAGRVVGQIVDGQTGQPLPGAQVLVRGTGLGSLAGIEGRYAIDRVPAGTLALEVTMLGYGTKTVTGIEVRPGGVVQLTVALDAAAVQVDGIEVTVQQERGSVGALLNAQRTAAGVVNAIGAEQIGRSPDSDAAAAVQRVSGVTVQDGKYVFVRGLGERYTTTSLNGSRLPSPEPERKMVPLDLFPTSLIQAITTRKTFTPNLDGDFSGAQVDIRTQEYPGSRQVSLSMSQGYNPAVSGKLLPMAPRAGGEWLASATRPRAMPPVVQHTLRPQPGPQANAMVNAMRNAWSVQERRGGWSSSFGAAVGGSENLFGHGFGYLVSGTYGLGDEVQYDALRENVEGDRYDGTVGRQSVLVGGLLNASTMLGRRTRISLNGSYNRTADNEARLERGFYENHGTNIQIERLRYVERAVRSSQFTAQHQITDRQRLDWSVTSASVSRQEPDRSEFVTWLDPEVPTWYNQEGAFRAYGGLTESGLEGSADYQFALGVRRSNLLRVGGLVRRTDRDAYDTGYAIRTREWTPTDPRWQLSAEDIFDGRFSENGEDLFDLGIFNAGGSYGARDRMLAAYGMIEWSLTRRARFTGGARLERSGLELTYEDVLANRGVVRPEYTDLLPAATLVFDVNGTQQLRLAASRTLARPEYREIAPACYRAGLGEEQRCGNPDLRRTLIQNYDARWERYTGYDEVVSVALFAKRFTDPIEPRYQGRSGTNSLWFENAARAVNYGVEVEARQNLGSIASVLTDVSAFVNGTLMKSEVRTGQDGDPSRPMTGQAPYVVNLGLTWVDANRVSSATVLFNVVGPRIVNARPSGQTVADVRELPRPGLDLSLRFPVGRALAGKLDLRNLLNSAYEVHQGDLVRAYHRSGRSMSFGLSWQRQAER